jgi:peptide deformylase
MQHVQLTFKQLAEAAVKLGATPNAIRVCSLATDLLDTLRAASAIGITATHIGVLKRLAVIELAAADGVRT